MFGTLDGIDGGELSDAVDALPLVESLCKQNSELVKQVNLLQGVIGGLELGPLLEAIDVLTIPELPTELDPLDFGCSAS